MAINQKRAVAVSAVKANDSIVDLDKIERMATEMHNGAIARLRRDAASATDDTMGWLVQDYQRTAYMVAKAKKAKDVLAGLADLMGPL